MRDIQNSRLENLGRGGATSGDVVRRQLDPAIRLQPGLVTLSVGPNDITTGVSVDVYEQHIDIIFSRLRQETAALVVVNLLPDLAVTSRFARGAQVDLVGRQTAMFNEALARKAREYGVVLVDLYRPSREEVPRQPELLWKDGYHPSDAGYARWAELMWEDIDPRLADCGSQQMLARRSGAQPAIPIHRQERATRRYGPVGVTLRGAASSVTAISRTSSKGTGVSTDTQARPRASALKVPPVTVGAPARTNQI